MLADAPRCGVSPLNMIKSVASFAILNACSLFAACAEAGSMDVHTAAWLSASPWTQTLTWTAQTLTSPNGHPVDAFGYAVGVDGTTAIIGASNEPADSDGFQGAAYVFSYAGGTWSETQRLTASDAAIGDSFGSAIAIDGPTAIIGAPIKQIGNNAQQGEAYVFEFDGTSWNQTQTLTASDGAALDQFGVAIVVRGDTALISAEGKFGPNGEDYAGAVYVFQRGNGTWTETQKLLPDDLEALDSFGASVDLEGDTAVIGANESHWTQAGPGSGAVYVFTYDGTQWQQAQRLTGDDSADGDFFGNAVGISGGDLTVGAPAATIDGHASAGATYVFNLSGGEWTQSHKLVVDDTADGNFFGRSMSLRNGVAFIGAVGETVASQPFAGAAYRFSETGGVWSQDLRAVASDPAPGDYLGYAVGMSADGTLLVAGATHQIDDGSGSSGFALAESASDDTIFSDSFDGSP